MYVDNQPVGTTPCATSFIYYGTREIRLVKPGYETLTVKQPIPAPWYEIPPLDFASENIAPSEIQDYRTVTYNLAPQVIVPTDQLVARAEQLRTATQQGGVLPASAVAPADWRPRRPWRPTSVRARRADGSRVVVLSSQIARRTSAAFATRTSPPTISS